MLVALCLATIGACARDEQAATSLPVAPEQPEAGEAPASRLLGGYWQMVINDLGGVEQQTRSMRYQPWQFDAGADLFFFSPRSRRWVVSDPGPYRGWDFLSTREHRHASVNYPAMDYVFLRLTRDATVAVVWYGSPNDLPSWLRSWQRDADVRVNDTARPTYRTTLPAGDHYLGTMEGRNNQMYTVLLAEADGTPSPLPHVPTEWGPRIEPNTVIPRDHILHNIHFAQSPDGTTHPTWHEQIHPAYWAYFEHDHGSDPALFPAFPEVQPLWAYTDPSIDDDLFFGFKVFVFEFTTTDGRDLTMMVTAHLDNITRRRLCERFHTLDIAIADTRTGELKARLHMLADTGYARSPEGTRVRPLECPDVIDIDSPQGRRNVNVLTPGAYESWQYDLTYASALPFESTFAILQEVPLTVIGDERDANGHYTAQRLIHDDQPHMGTSRHLIFAGATFGFAPSEGGTFCTDRHARTRTTCGPDTLTQYIEPGFSFSARVPGRYGVDDPWTGLYTPKTLTDRDNGAVINVWRNLENAVRMPN